MITHHIPQYEATTIPYLVERLSLEPDDIENGSWPDWYDVDHVKTHGELGRGDTMFIVITRDEDETEDTRWVIYYDEPDDDAIELVEWWLDGAKGDLIGDGEGQLENSWDDWDKVQTGIAYRGGSGYCYALYAKELKDDTDNG